MIKQTLTRRKWNSSFDLNLSVPEILDFVTANLNTFTGENIWLNCAMN